MRITTQQYRQSACLLWAAALASCVSAAGFDHRLSYDNSGIWARHNQQALQYATIAVEFGGALWFGSDEPLGRTFWQSVDASVFSSVTAEAAKRVFGRARPSQTEDPNQWFKGNCCHSFPSGEVALQASFVTPFIANYAAAHPWIWALEVLPIYDGVARLKTRSHWQTDVLAGWAIGSAFGYYATKREQPVFVEILPKGVTIGLRKAF